MTRSDLFYSKKCVFVSRTPIFSACEVLSIRYFGSFMRPYNSATKRLITAMSVQADAPISE